MCLAYPSHWMKLKMSFIMSAFMYLDKEVQTQTNTGMELYDFLTTPRRQR